MKEKNNKINIYIGIIILFIIIIVGVIIFNINYWGVLQMEKTVGKESGVGENEIIENITTTQQDMIGIIDNVININMDEAIEQLEDSGFIIKKVFEMDENIKRGNVIRIEPEIDDKFDYGATIIVYISQGSDLVVEVPNVVGKMENEATEILNTEGLAINIQREYSETIPAGQVICQDVKGGTLIDFATSDSNVINVVVSLGKLIS